MITVLTLPGWHNSGPLHWQTLWEQQNQGFKRVQQRDWETPRREDWLANICDEVNAAPGSVVLVGLNDPWLSLDRAAHISAMWGSSFVNIGAAGHINSESGLADWPEGKRILRRLLEA